MLYIDINIYRYKRLHGYPPPPGMFVGPLLRVLVFSRRLG